MILDLTLITINHQKEMVQTYNSTNSSYPNFLTRYQGQSQLTATPTTSLYRTNSNTGNRWRLHYSQENLYKELHQRNHKQTSNSPNWWQVNEGQLGLSTNSPVMIINAKLNGKPARLLLDSGASGNFLKISFIKSLEKLDEPNVFKVIKSNPRI